MERIELTLRNAKLKSYHLISLILVFLNLIVQFAFTFTDAYKHDRILVIVFILVTLVLLFVKRGNKFNFTEKKNSIATVFIIAAAIWVKWEVYGIAALVILCDVLYIYAVRKFEVLVSRDRIIFPSFPKKNIQWSELQNMIIKDGILTIDFKNNKLFQSEIEGDDDVEEKTFNAFCREQLKK